MTDVFLLTRTLGEPRSDLCFELMEYSENPKLYLAGNGVFHLLNFQNLSILPVREILACREDILARGIPLMDEIIVPDDFYGRLVEDMMETADHVYVF